MSFSISITIDLKNNPNSSLAENILKDAAQNCNSINSYDDYDLEGTNNYVKTNNKVQIYEFDHQFDLTNFMKFIKNATNTFLYKIQIESIYKNNSIIYASKHYLNDISKTMHSKEDIIAVIEENKKFPDLKEIYNIINP